MTILLATAASQRVLASPFFSLLFFLNVLVVHLAWPSSSSFYTAVYLRIRLVTTKQPT